MKTFRQSTWSFAIGAVTLIALWGCGSNLSPNSSASAEPYARETTSNQNSTGKGDIFDAQRESSASATPFRYCQSGTIPSGLPQQDWDQFTNSFVTNIGNPLHSASDMITNPGESVELKAKFSYGLVSKDLEEESIQVWIDNCTQTLRRLGTATTNDDGRIQFKLEGAETPPVGVYKVYFRVPGDNSSTTSVLRVVPEETKFVVFDIDETLSSEPSTGTLRDIISDGYNEAHRPGAIAATNIRRFHQHYQIIYLTARPYLLTDHTRDWLDRHGFAPGTLHLVQDLTDMVPMDSRAGDYKYDYLDKIESHGISIERAYGNAETDIYAYRQLGLPGDEIFVLGENGGKEGTVDLGDSYVDHLQDLRAQPAVEQPFDSLSSN